MEKIHQEKIWEIKILRRMLEIPFKQIKIISLKPIVLTQIVEMILFVSAATEVLLTPENMLKINAKLATKRLRNTKRTQKYLTKFINTQVQCRGMDSRNLILSMVGMGAQVMIAILLK